MVYSYLVWLILDYWPFRTIHWWPSNHHLTIIIHGWFLEVSWVIGGIPSHHPAIRWVFSPEKKPSTCGVFRGFSRTPPFKRLKGTWFPQHRPRRFDHVDRITLSYLFFESDSELPEEYEASKRRPKGGDFMGHLCDLLWFIVILCDLIWYSWEITETTSLRWYLGWWQSFRGS